MTIENGLIIESNPVLLRERIAEFWQWERSPGKFEKKQTITAKEYQAIRKKLIERFRDQVWESALARSGRAITKGELDLVHEILNSVQRIEDEKIKDEERRPWNPTCVDHTYKVVATAVVMAEDLKLDVSRIKARTLLHDIGRFASHHPIIHGLAGRKLVKDMGFAADFKITTLTHLEAGAGPFVVGIDSSSWPEISQDLDGLQAALDQAPLIEVLIATADMGRGGDPIENLVGPAKRRLTIGNGEPTSQTLISLASNDRAERKGAIEALRNLGADEENINRMAMYFGLCAALKRRLKKEGFVFDDEMVVRAEVGYQQLLQEHPINN